MSQFTSTTPNSGSITVNGLDELKALRDVQAQLYNAVFFGNNGAEIVRLLNLIPTIAATFKITGPVSELATKLGEAGEKAADDQKTLLLTRLNNGYKFFNTQVTNWNTSFYKVKFDVPLAYLFDRENDYNVLRYIAGAGSVVSKTTKDGKVTITQ